jgi:hypothetical protein
LPWRESAASRPYGEAIPSPLAGEGGPQGRMRGFWRLGEGRLSAGVARPLIRQPSATTFSRKGRRKSRNREQSIEMAFRKLKFVERWNQINLSRSAKGMMCRLLDFPPS